ncbi:hypothetical protein COF75_26575 [Bacillus toyonensis]|nr:hypothetical protein CN594_34205 [Bacillus toyonensis]PFY36827.1 hypothetical protein COL54_25535 [Bacillus toyonensis]PFY72803.1 hypothetical protein COL62_24465 [Bacillus toyonensis]PGD07568.1 hypothetical protein COM37_32460 [Bacillus toyonensis]PHD39309.1 hypothetical protein COF75_26575 [Bacillus toyonensis]
MIYTLTTSKSVCRILLKMYMLIQVLMCTFKLAFINRSKKTLQIVINHLLQMVFVNLLQKVCANHPSVKPVASWATKDIRFS